MLAGGGSPQARKSPGWGPRVPTRCSETPAGEPGETRSSTWQGTGTVEAPWKRPCPVNGSFLHSAITYQPPAGARPHAVCPVSRVANTTNVVPVLREGASRLQEEKDVKQIAASIHLYTHTHIWICTYM